MTTTPIFHDGFDHYGPIGLINSVLTSKLNEWWTNAGNVASSTIVAGLSSTGFALKHAQTGINMSKTLGANYSKIAGTLRFSTDLLATSGVTFLDGVNAQFSVSINVTTGVVSLRTGGGTGATINSGSSVSANSTHTLSWDVTVGAAAAYSVYLDGISIFSGTGNTRGGSSNNYVNAVAFATSGNTNNFTTDDFAIIDGSVAFDASLLTSNPRLETQIGTGDVQTQFTNGGTILGEAYSLTTNTNAPGANQIWLRRYIPEVNETINSVSILPAQTSGTAKFKAGLYPDSAGSPNGQARLSDGTEVIGCTSGTVLAAPLATPTALTAGTPYWIAIISDTSILLSQNDTGTNGVRAAATYTSGVPATCPTVTTGQPNWIMYGNCTGAAVNWPAVKHNPAPGDISNVASSTVGNEDLLSFPALSTNPTTIFFGAVMANVKRTDAGARTLDLRVKSSTTDSAGSSAGQSPALSYGWLNSYFPLDPATGVGWTPSGWNGSSAGYKIAA